MPTIPTATGSDDNVRYTLVATIPDTAAPIAATLNAGVELSCWMTDDGWQPSMSQASVSDKRACSSQDFEGAGRKAYSLKIKYVTAPQSATNTAHTTLIPGTLTHVVERRGLPVDTAYAALQKVNIRPVEVGAYNPLAPEANGKFKEDQVLFIRGPVVIDAVVV